MMEPRHTAAVCKGHTMAQCPLGHTMGCARQLCVRAIVKSGVCSSTAELESSKKELQRHQEGLQRRIEHKFTGMLAGQL